MSDLGKHSLKRFDEYLIKGWEDKFEPHTHAQDEIVTIDVNGAPCEFYKRELKILKNQQQMNNKVYILDAQSGAGKDSIAWAFNLALYDFEESGDISYEELLGQKKDFLTNKGIYSHSIKRLAMADFLKQMSAKANGESVSLYYDQTEKDNPVSGIKGGKTRRQFLIDYSFEIKEKHGCEFFVNKVLQEAEWYLSKGKNVVITDCRFDFEMEAIKNKFGSLVNHIHVISPDSKRHDMDDKIDRTRFKPHFIWYNQKDGEFEMINRARMILQNKTLRSAKIV